MDRHLYASSLLLIFLVNSQVVTGQQLEHLGCFDLNYALSQSMHTRMSGVQLPLCVLFCTGKGKTQIGIERSDNFCYCGDDIAEESTKRSDALCNVPCANEYDNYTCGGDWLMSVYRLVPLSTTQAPAAGNLPETTSGDDIGFLVGMEDGALLYKSKSISTYDRLLSSANIYSVDYHFSKGWAFEHSKGRLFRSSLVEQGHPGIVPFKAIRTITGICEGFAVDWVENRVYFAECTYAGVTISGMDLDGNNVFRLFVRPGEPANVKRMRVDPFKRQLFWTADGVVESCDLSGNNYTTKLSPEGLTVRALALDLEAQRVYYMGVNTFSTPLYSMDYQGGNVTRLYSAQQMRSVYGMEVFRDSVYWVNYANSKDIIYKGPKQKITGTDVDIQMLTAIGYSVWDLRLVHPDLQRLPKNGSCPKGFELDNDRGTCSDTSAEPSTTTSEATTTSSTTLSTSTVENIPQNGTQVHSTTIEPEKAADPSKTPSVETVTSTPTESSTHNEADSSKNSTLTKDTSAAAPSSTTSRALFVVFFIVVGILLLASLAYLSDRYWLTIRGKMLRVSYQRERGTEGSVTPQLERNKTEDSVRLI